MEFVKLGNNCNKYKSVLSFLKYTLFSHLCFFAVSTRAGSTVLVSKILNSRRAGNTVLVSKISNSRRAGNTVLVSKILNSRRAGSTVLVSKILNSRRAGSTVWVSNLDSPNSGTFLLRVFGKRKRTADAADITYPCPNMCGKSYLHKGSLTFHLKYECGKEPQFEYELKEEPPSLEPFELDLHNMVPVSERRKIRGDDIRRFACPNNCGRVYKYKGNMTVHFKLECGKEPSFMCKFCKKKFTKKGNLKTHLGKFNGGCTENYPCLNGCGRIYKHKASLWKHLTFECGQEPKFSCQFCTAKFRQKSSLMRHIGLIHKILVGA
ncbi:hypothetical protein V9T40_010903 [Parthenolecanium corni]|uniref:C2H2-type domain-containing protein n=1 Tax=Parthenolecanium corni TaxID=536013 RepID=A0AAN9THM1_9HEMI